MAIDMLKNEVISHRGLNTISVVSKKWSVLVMTMIVTSQAFALEKSCQISTGAQKNTVIELFTSDGCSSCPPADKWLSKIVKVADKAVIPLTFHVTYWDYLGWRDEFAQSAFDARQSAYAKISPNSFNYTPEVFTNAQELRQWYQTQGGATARGDSVPVNLRLSAKKTSDKTFTIETVVTKTDSAQIDLNKAKLHFFLYENQLTSIPNGGELNGVHLSHDRVVRAWQTLDAVDLGKAQTRSFTLGKSWMPRNMGVVAVLQSSDLKTIYQAADLSGCL